MVTAPETTRTSWSMPPPNTKTEAAPPVCASGYCILVVSVILIGALLRFVALDALPQPAHQDELSDIYDGYCIATTGADRVGDRWPIVIRGMGPGDYHPGLYAYLAGVTTRVFGLSVWAGRLPAAVAGVLTLVLVFLVVRRILGRRLALVALLLIVFQPAHVLFSRQAHTGGCLPPLFAILIVYLLLRTVEALRKRGSAPASIWVVATGFAVGFSTNAYGASRLSGLLFAVVCVAFVVQAVGIRHGGWRRAIAPVTILALSIAVGAAPQLYAAIDDPTRFFARAANVVPPLGYGPRWWIGKLLEGVTANLSPHHLFLSFGEHRLLTISRLSLVSLPFLYLGIAVVAFRSTFRPRAAYVLLLLATAVSLAPAVTSFPNPHPLRASGVWALYPIFVAVGAGAAGQICVAALNWIRSGTIVAARTVSAVPSLAPRIGTALLAVAIAAFGLANVVRYLDRPELHGPDAQYHLHSLVQWLKTNDDRYDRVYADLPGLFPYLYVAVYTEMPPEEFRRAPRRITVTARGWEQFDRFGKYFFAGRLQADAAWAASNKNERWLLLTAEGDVVAYGSDNDSDRFAGDGGARQTRTASVSP